MFSIDHKDGTSSYYEDEDGTGHVYDNSKELLDFDYRRSQIKIRE